MLSLLLVVAPTCGGDDAPADASPAAIDGAVDARGLTVEEALAQGSATLCARLAECAPAFLTFRFAGDVSACTAREIETLGPVLGLPGVTLTAEQLLACEAAMAPLSCDGLLKFLLGNFGEFPDACLIDGTRADGEACTHAYQCQTGWCVRPQGTACGTCAAPLTVGAACTDPAECAPGSQCLNSACVAFGAIGEACSAAAPCYGHLTCAGGTCAAAVADGGACTMLTGQCDLWGGELVCDTAADVCVSLLYAAPGEACGLLPAGATVCSAGDCFPSLLMGTCFAPAADGAACSTTAGPGCLFHSECRAGTCESIYATTCP